jgi:hypothetical protein
VDEPSGWPASITAWCTAAVGAVLMLVSALLPDRLLVLAEAAGLVLVVVGLAVFFVRLLRD